MTKHVLYLFSIISSYHYTNQNKTSKQQKTKTNQKKATTTKEPVYMNNIWILQLIYDVITWWYIC